MRGKQSRDIYFENKHHMDALLQDPQKGKGPYYANAICFCDDEESIDPTKEETKNKLNKVEYLWRKIYDDSWLDDSRYFVITDNWYEFAWEQWYNTGFNLVFPYYKTFEHGGITTNYNTRRMYCSLRNGLLVDIRGREATGHRGPFDTGYYDDYVDGKRYDFSDNLRLSMQFTQNGIDFYPFFLGKNTNEGPLASYYRCLIASTGIYLQVSYGTAGLYSNEEDSFVFIPYTLHDDATKKVTIGEPRYLGKKIDKYLRPQIYNPNYSSSVDLYFTIKQYVFMISREYEDMWISETETIKYQYLIITRMDPDGNIKRTNLMPMYSYNIEANYQNGMCNIVYLNDKVYIPLRVTPEYLGDKQEEDSPRLPEFWYMSIDENCSTWISHAEPVIVEWVGGYDRIRVYNNSFEEIMNAYNGGLIIYYDKKTELYYIYNMISSRSKAFPAGGPDDPEFRRLIIATTRDFHTISYSEPANRYILIHNDEPHWNTLAVCFDTRLADELSAQYPTTYLTSSYGNINESSSQEGQHRFSFHNEKLSNPDGIFSIVQLVNKGYRQRHIGMVFYIANPTLLPSENDFIYSVWDYPEDYPSSANRELKGIYDNTLINKLNGLE